MYVCVYVYTTACIPITQMRVAHHYCVYASVYTCVCYCVYICISTITQVSSAMCHGVLHVCVCVHACVCMCTRIPFPPTHHIIYAGLCACAGMCTCVHVCMCVCVCVCVCVHRAVHVCECMYMKKGILYVYVRMHGWCAARVCVRVYVGATRRIHRMRMIFHDMTQYIISRLFCRT